MPSFSLPAMSSGGDDDSGKPAKIAFVAFGLVFVITWVGGGHS